MPAGTICPQTKKQKAEVAQQAKAASEGPQPARPKAKSKAEHEAERHRKKIAGRPSRKGKNTLMEVRAYVSCCLPVPPCRHCRPTRPQGNCRAGLRLSWSCCHWRPTFCALHVHALRAVSQETKGAQLGIRAAKVKEAQMRAEGVPGGRAARAATGAGKKQASKPKQKRARWKAGRDSTRAALPPA